MANPALLAAAPEVKKMADEMKGAILGSSLGLLKSVFVDPKARQAEVMSKAIDARFAPLQGKASPSFGPSQIPSGFQNVMDMGLAGIAQGRKVAENRDEKARFAEAQAKSDREEARSNKLLDALTKSLQPQATAEEQSLYAPTRERAANMASQSPAYFGTNYNSPAEAINPEYAKLNAMFGGR